MLCGPNGLKIRRNDRKEELQVGGSGLIRLNDGVLQKIKRTDNGYLRVGTLKRLEQIGLILHYFELAPVHF
jgi:hypothetical protein